MSSCFLSYDVVVDFQWFVPFGELNQRAPLPRAHLPP